MKLASLIASIKETLAGAGVPSPRVDAEALVGHVVRLSRSDLHLQSGLDIAPSLVTRARELARRRAERVPLQYLTGEIEFMSLPFAVTEGVFVPRPETETLVEALIARTDRTRPPRRILDLCTGCGVIAVSLAKSLGSDLVLGCDISLAAVEIAAKNAIMNGVEAGTGFIVGDGLDFLNSGSGERWRFDMVACNPPYIESGAIRYLEPEVRDHEPRNSIDGGPDGLTFVERVVPEIASILRVGGLAALEIGASQGARAKALIERTGFGELEVLKDLGGLDRVVLGRKG